VWIGAAVLAAAVLLVALVLANKSDDSSSAAGENRISGSFDDWLQSVCQSGTYIDGAQVPFINATGSGSCRPSHGYTGGRIWIGNWNSDYVMRNDMVAGHCTYYVSGRNGQLITAFAVQGRSSEPLAPLTQFGYSINTAGA